MKNAKIHEFNPVIYPYRLWVVISNEPTVISKTFHEYSGKPIEYIERDTCNSAAFAMPVMRKVDSLYGVVLFFRSKKSMTYELVAHESSHAAKYLFEHIGSDIKEHEPFEYVVGWIAGCCERMKNNKCQ